MAGVRERRLLKACQCQLAAMKAKSAAIGYSASCRSMAAAYPWRETSASSLAVLAEMSGGIENIWRLKSMWLGESPSVSAGL